MNGFSLSRDHASGLARTQAVMNVYQSSILPPVQQEQLETHTTARLPNYDPISMNRR